MRERARASVRSGPALRVPRALAVTVVQLVAGAGLGALVAAAAGCDGGAASDAGRDGGDECTVFVREDGSEIYRLCPVAPGSECANRIYPDGGITDGGC